MILTAIDGGAAADFARKLVENRLSACVSMLPKTQSVYRWKGAIESAEETLLIIKTDIGKLQAIRDFFDQNHSYELPEFIYMDCEAGEKYLNWVLENAAPNI